MDDTEKKQLEEFIRQQLIIMGKNLGKAYNKNKNARKQNPFLHFQEGIDKFMGLGRSIDSQLGNRMQNIIFYLCRLRYGFRAVPNIVVLNVDQDTQEIVLDVFYADICLDLSKFYSGKNLCTQTIYYNQTITLDKATELIHIQKRVVNNSPDVIKHETKRFAASAEQIAYVINKMSDKPQKDKKQAVDLLVLKMLEERTEILTFEIKMSGNLDTKNAPSNAKEVEDLYKIFRFVPHNSSYFAVCYGMCSDAVQRSMVKEAPDGDILDETGLWNLVLPNTGAKALKYQEFKEIYKKAFKDSELEGTITKLGT